MLNKRLAEEIIKLDFMSKRSQMRRILKSDNYQDRWFKLTPTSLSYYNGTISSGCSKLKGEIDLQTIKVVEEVNGSYLGNKTNVFQIVYTPTGGLNELTLYIIATNENQKDEWIEAVRKAAQKKEANFSNFFHVGIWLYNLKKFSCCDNINKKSKGCQNSHTFNLLAGKGTNGTSCHKPTDNDLKKFMALFAYSSTRPEEIDLTKGEEYELMSENMNENWVQVKNAAGIIGLVPATHIQPIDSENLDQYEWYYKNISGERCKTILEQMGKDGCFMVRCSSKQEGVFTLALYVRPTSEAVGTVKHYHIQRDDTNGKFYLTYKHKFQNIPQLICFHKHSSAGLETILQSTPVDMVQPTIPLKTNYIKRNDICILEKLGCGLFGTTMKGKYKDDIVAIKIINSITEKPRSNEIQLLEKLEHRNLLKLYGTYIKEQPYMIITEFMILGPLSDYLRDNKPNMLKNARINKKLIDMCIDVCQAMDFLEGINIIHGNLSARNCFVGENDLIKVGNFAFSKIFMGRKSNIYEEARFRWNPIEVIQEQIYSSKTDVWAFGVVIWEIFTYCESPLYGGLDNNAVYRYLIEEKKRLPKPDNCPDLVYSLMIDCWEEDPQSRPNFSKIQKDLVNISC